MSIKPAANAGSVSNATTAARSGRGGRSSRLTQDRVWKELTRASFAVVSYVTPAGSPRSSGVVYAVAGRRMYVVVAEDSWKAKHIAASGQVAVTAPVRRGGLMSLIFPIPPATISFRAAAIVHRADSPADRPLPERLTSLVPPERRAGSCIIEIEPTGMFVTYGVGVALRKMRNPTLARARVPVG